MLQSLREETEGKCQMLLSHRKNGLASLFKEVRGFQGIKSRSLLGRGPETRNRAQCLVQGPAPGNRLPKSPMVGQILQD